MVDLSKIFNKTNADCNIGDLARVLGIFSERIPEIFFENVSSRYELVKNNKGEKLRPCFSGSKTGVDFFIRNKETDKYYIVEQKCFPAFDNCKLLSMGDNKEFVNSFKTWCNRKIRDNKNWRKFLEFKHELDKGSLLKNIPIQQSKKAAGSILIWIKKHKELDKPEKFLNHLLKEFENEKKLAIDDVIFLEDMINESYESKIGTKSLKKSFLKFKSDSDRLLALLLNNNK
jgi:hypothetical protein